VKTPFPGSSCYVDRVGKIFSLAFPQRNFCMLSSRRITLRSPTPSSSFISGNRPPMPLGPARYVAHPIHGPAAHFLNQQIPVNRSTQQAGISSTQSLECRVGFLPRILEASRENDEYRAIEYRPPHR
jgi:hypothetical protein